MNKMEPEPRLVYSVKIPFPMTVPYSLADLAQEELEAELPKTVERVLKTAQENGWVLNGKGMTMVIRLDKPDDPDAVPFYCSWQLVIAKDGQRRWQFTGAAAANWQPLTFHDVFTYLKDPSVIWPEEITEEGK